MSQDTYGSKIQKRATFRQSKFQHSNISRDTIYYESWLQRKKYSHDIREKLLRNS